MREFNYGLVEWHVEAVAGAIAARGVGHGDRVALVARNCCEWSVALLAILRVSAAAVPLYSEISQDEAQRIVEDAQPRLIVGSDQVVERLHKLKLPALTWPGEPPASLEDSLATPEREGARPPELSHIGDPAMIIYTSGTTAQPKGVMLSHHNILSNIESFTSFVSVNNSDRLLMVLPLHHVFPLTVGLLAAARLGRRPVRDARPRRADPGGPARSYPCDRLLLQRRDRPGR